MLIFPRPNIFSIQYLIHSQHIAIHLKYIVTIWELPYFRNGRKMQDPLPLWQGTEGRRDGGPGCHEKCLSQGAASSGASATAGKCGFRCRCGKGRRTWVAQEVPLARNGQFRGFHNGRKMQDSLPLWNGAEDRGNMERRYFMVIPPEGPPTAASPKPSTRRRGPPGH